MFHASKKARRPALWLMAAAVIPLSMLVLSLSPAEESASALYIVSNDGGVVDLEEPEAQVFLTDAGAELVSRQGSSDLYLTAGMPVTIDLEDRDERMTTVSQEETVTQLLSRMEIEPSPLEMVAVDFEEDSLIVTIGSQFLFYEHITNVDEHEVVYQYNDQKPDWYESVIQEGRDGLYSEVYEIVYQDGRETSRQLIDVVEEAAQPTVIEVGTIPNFANNADPVADIAVNEDGSGVITLENGETVTFRETRTMRGTAYTAWENSKVDDVTATGTTVRLGVVAVDKRQIPLGTKVYVVSNDGAYAYGFAIAEDTGVRGNTIDLYMNTYEDCIQFGVRDCTVYILD